jgi:hypothetical protein
MKPPSISYAPDSTPFVAPPAPSTAARQPAWILCRKLEAFPIPDDAMLRSWAERGRIRPDDYLVNPCLDTCRQAKEIADLEVIFHQATVQRLEKISSLLAWGASAIRSLRRNGERP